MELKDPEINASDHNETKEKNEFLLKRRLDYEHATVQCMRTLLEPGSIDDILPRILKIVHRVVDNSRTYIFKNEPDPELGLCMSQIYEAVSQGIEPQINNPELQHLSYNEATPTLLTVLENRHHFAYLVEELEDPERTILSEQGILSVLIIPIYASKDFWGFIGFDDCEKAREWDENDIDLLRIVADGIGELISHRKAENELRESEALLNEVGRIGKIGGWEYDVASGNGKWTSEVYRIHEVEMDSDLSVADTLEFYPAESRKLVEKAFNDAIEKAKPYDLELELITGKGNHKWIRTRGRPTIENGKNVKIIGSFQDITEYKNAEKKRRESEEKLKIFIEHAPVTIAMLDRNMQHIAVSRKWLEELGSTEDIIGLSHYEVYPFINNEVREAHQRALKGDIVRKEEDRIKLPDGSIRWTRWEVRPWKASDGTIGGIIIFSENITERKESEIALKESKALLSEVGEIAKIGGWELDVKSNKVTWTEEVEEIQGIEDVSNPGESLKLFLPESKKILKKALDDAIKNAEPYELDLEMISGRGDYKWVRAIAKPVMEGNKVVKLTGTLQDITIIKEAELKLLESESCVRRKLNAIMEPEGDIAELELTDIIDKEPMEILMQNFYNLTHISVGIIDLEGNILIATGWQDICMNFHRKNPESCKHCIESDRELSNGVEPGKFKAYKCKNNMWDVATPIVVGGTHMGNLLLGQFFLEEEEIPYETFKLQAKKYGFDEKEYFDALEKVPRWNQETIKETMEFYMQLTNVMTSMSYSNIKLARTLEERDGLLNSLHDSEEKLKLFIEHAPASLAMFDKEMRYISASRRWMDDFSLDKQDIIGISHYEIFPELTDELKEVHRRALEGEVISNEEDRFERADETIQWLHWEVRPWKIFDGTIGGIVIFSEDITERKKAEHSLIEAKMLAEHNNRIKSEFLANMSHELRTPLTAVIGFSDILQEGTVGELTEKQLGYINNINKGGKHLLEIINGILDLSKVEAGKMDLECEDFIISKIIDETLNSMSSLSVRKNIKFILENNVDEMNIHADKAKLRQILYNLLTNAIKFTPENGEVSVSIDKTDNGIQVSVKDTGIGIPAEMQEEIFSPFTQVDASSKRRYGGTGLGLALVKKFVEMHNGKVWLESEEGKGSTFTFTIENQKKNE